MRRFTEALIVAAALMAGCGGKGANPTAPSNTGGNTPVTPAGPMATITGSVQGAAANAVVARSGGPALTGVTVTVVGTSISVSVDVAGRFTLLNVPPGDGQLQLSGSANGTLPISSVQPLETIDLVVMVSGSAASIDSQVRSGTGQADLEGRVESLPPTMPPRTFKAAGRQVTTDSATRFLDGSITRSFADLQLGMRVHVKGSLSGDTFTATIVELQNAHIVPVEVNGVIDSLTGSAAAFQFKIGSRVVKGDVNTAFFGDGDKPDTFADLKNGARVEVKGQQRDDFVYATRIHINGTGTEPPQDTSASIHGVLESIGGIKPTLVLLVDTTTVRTTSGTEVKRRGDVQTLDTLQLGQSLHVIGVRQADGSLDARLIEIDDDATGGAFEIEGSLGGLKGTCPAVQFGVNGFSIVTSASTTFEGAACTALKGGDKVTVKGVRQADGSVAATKVTRN